MPRNNKPYLVIDFDSTLVQAEGLEELGDIALEGRNDKHQILEEVERITNMGMEGKIDFTTSLTKRLNVLPIHKDHIEDLVPRLKSKITPSVLENKEFFSDNSDRIFIISGGFREFISPVALSIGLKPGNVLANEFRFDDKGKVTGFDPDNLLSQKDGKVKQIQDLELDGEIWVVGDGWTDYKIKEEGAADRFIAFIGNVCRQQVKDRADMVAADFKDIINNC